MDASMKIAKAINALDCPEPAKQALRELFNLERGALERPTKKQYMDVIEKYAQNDNKERG